jgi:MFS transporter, MHS family, proline/betaine transporter
LGEIATTREEVTVAVPYRAHHDISRSALFAAAFASIAGWSFDLFDLFVLLYVADVLSKVIFPASSPTLSLAAVYGSFAVSVLLRPAGAAIFGALCDRRGRKPTMAIVLTGVGLATGAMGAVPAYHAIGLWSPAIFLALRILQGTFVGGVAAATHTLGTETVGPRWRGLMSGAIGSGGAGIGAALASALYILLSHLFPGAQFDQWGWRVMFFAGLVATAASYLVLRAAEESPMWRAQQAEARQARAGQAAAGPARARLTDLVRGGEARVFAVNVTLVAGAGSLYYLTSGYLPTLLGKVVGIGPSIAGVILLISSVGVLVSALAGHLSERLGRRRTMLLIGVVDLVALPLLTWLIARTPAHATTEITGYVVALVFLANASYTPILVFLNERYPTALRSRGTAVCWNTGFMIGGLMPTFLSLASPSLSAIPGRLIAFLLVMVVVYLAGAVLSPETRGAMDRAAMDGGDVEGRPAVIPVEAIKAYPR